MNVKFISASPLCLTACWEASRLAGLLIRSFFSHSVVAACG
ncbi:hypothetical protein GbCGDNIH6_8249 [Granulibacter bethesdensis]|nr:hypothetical protein GbCGDNIH6_8249 [Granulibacter bethesdensis]